MVLFRVQVISIGVTIATCFLGCILPSIFVERMPDGTQWLHVVNYLTCVSGGVFAAAFFIMYNSTQAKMASLLADYPTWSDQMAITACLVFVGYLLTVLLEKAVMRVQLRMSASSTSYGRQPSETLCDDDTTALTAQLTAGGGGGETTEEEDDDAQRAEHHHFMVSDGGGHNHHHHHHHGISAGIEDPSLSAMRKFIMILTSLSAHSVFEGITLGLQTQFPLFMKLYLSILIHEVLVAFAVGMSLSEQARISRASKFVISFCFSVIIPFGQLLGLLIQDSPQYFATQLMSTGVQAVGIGTFLHVTFHEILGERISAPNFACAHLSFMALGFVMIPLASLWHHESDATGAIHH